MLENPKAILDPLMAGLPIIALIWMMTKKNSLPAWQALPTSAALLYIVKWLYFGSDMRELHASIVAGLLYAYTPLMIAWGAITLFLTMEATGCMDRIRVWLGDITQNKTAQLMIIGWAFSFLIEGASGFGTPVALSAPLLVALGFTPFKTAIFCLLMNTVPVSFGAVGTPTWFGLSVLNLDQSAILDISFKSAAMHFAAGMIICPLGIWMTLGREELKKNFVFVMLSALSCLLPYLVLSKFNYEFPAILGGGIGLALSAFMARHGIGLAKEEGEQPLRELGEINATTVFAFLPLWGSILILLITRIKEFGVKGFLTSSQTALHINLGTLGDFSISPALLMKLSGIFHTEVSWEQRTLYIPGIIPFIVLSLITMFIFRLKRKKAIAVFTEAYERITTPAIALFGALTLVNMLMLGGERSCAMTLGESFASATGRGWTVFAPFLGALGTFFAGSSTVSNLTFGGIQASIAKSLSLDPALLVALQSVGSAMGSMVGLNNIVTVSSILGIPHAMEGKILKRTFLPMIAYGLIAVATGVILVKLHLA